MRNGAMAHQKPPVPHQWAMAHRLGTTDLVVAAINYL